MLADVSQAFLYVRKLWKWHSMSVVASSTTAMPLHSAGQSSRPRAAYRLASAQPHTVSLAIVNDSIETFASLPSFADIPPRACLHCVM